MSVVTKLPFPNDGSLVDERDKYTDLYDTQGRSTTGNKQFTSTTSLNIYDTTGTEWDNNGNEGLMGLLFYGDRDNPLYSKPTLVLYNLDSDTYNSLIKDSVFTTVDETILTYNVDGSLATASEKISATQYKLETLSYTLGVLVNVNTKIYNVDGITIDYEYDEVLNYTGSILISVDKVVV